MKQKYVKIHSSFKLNYRALSRFPISHPSTFFFIHPSLPLHSPSFFILPPSSSSLPLHPPSFFILPLSSSFLLLHPPSFFPFLQLSPPFYFSPHSSSSFFNFFPISHPIFHPVFPNFSLHHTQVVKSSLDFLAVRTCWELRRWRKPSRSTPPP